MASNKFVEAEQKRKESVKSHSAAGEMAETVSGKKLVSFQASEDMYKQFTFVNKKKGLSNTAVLNMYIAKYVAENRELL